MSRTLSVVNNTALIGLRGLRVDCCRMVSDVQIVEMPAWTPALRGPLSLLLDDLELFAYALQDLQRGFKFGCACAWP